MARVRETIVSDFYCTQCGKKGIPIARKSSKQKEPEHLKKLYCIYCKKEINHAEVKMFGDYQKEDFLEEFNLGRFVDGNKIPILELLSCTHKECMYNKDGKCWNSNQSYECNHRPKGDDN